MLFQIRRGHPPSPKIFSSRLYRHTTPSRLEATLGSCSAGFVASQCFRLLVLVLQQQSCIHVCSGWNFRLGHQQLQCSNCSYCCTCKTLLKNACSVRTGYVFFGTLVNNRSSCLTMYPLISDKTSITRVPRNIHTLRACALSMHFKIQNTAHAAILHCMRCLACQNSLTEAGFEIKLYRSFWCEFSPRSESMLRSLLWLTKHINKECHTVICTP